jgi:hypothetical protein
MLLDQHIESGDQGKIDNGIVLDEFLLFRWMNAALERFMK